LPGTGRTAFATMWLIFALAASIAPIGTDFSFAVTSEFPKQGRQDVRLAKLECLSELHSRRKKILRRILNLSFRTLSKYRKLEFPQPICDRFTNHIKREVNASLDS
jgi:hypothetical protein